VTIVNEATHSTLTAHHIRKAVSTIGNTHPCLLPNHRTPPALPARVGSYFLRLISTETSYSASQLFLFADISQGEAVHVIEVLGELFAPFHTIPCQ